MLRMRGYYPKRLHGEHSNMLPYLYKWCSIILKCRSNYISSIYNFSGFQKNTYLYMQVQIIFGSIIKPTLFTLVEEILKIHQEVSVSSELQFSNSLWTPKIENLHDYTCNIYMYKLFCVVCKCIIIWIRLHERVRKKKYLAINVLNVFFIRFYRNFVTKTQY